MHFPSRVYGIFSNSILFSVSLSQVEYTIGVLEARLEVVAVESKSSTSATG